MNFNFKEIFTAFMVLFAVIDIIGNIPIIIDLRKKSGHIQSEKASLIAGFIMIVFLFLGQSLLKLIGIDVNSFAVAGSFILFFIALEMILGITLYKDNEDDSNSVPFTTWCRGKIDWEVREFLMGRGGDGEGANYGQAAHVQDVMAQLDFLDTSYLDGLLAIENKAVM